MKKIIYILSTFIITFFLASCDDENVDGIIDESAKPLVSFDVSATSAAEINSSQIVISITFDKPIKNSTTFVATQIGGNAVLHDDYEISGGVVPAYALHGEIIISINQDLEVEGNESIDFQIAPAPISDVYEVLGTTEVNLTIEDYVFCLWTLEAYDAYGDGWQGGHLTVDSDGTATDYSPEGFGSSFSIPITSGSSFTITYTSGTPGGGPGAPGYEEENTYILTGPDGSVYADGPVPTEGLIVSGICN